MLLKSMLKSCNAWPLIFKYTRPFHSSVLKYSSNLTKGGNDTVRGRDPSLLFLIEISFLASKVGSSVSDMSDSTAERNSNEQMSSAQLESLSDPGFETTSVTKTHGSATSVNRIHLVRTMTLEIERQPMRREPNN